MSGRAVVTIQRTNQAPAIGSGHLIEVSAAINRTNSAWSLARLPALSLPAASAELPVGAQIVGPPGGDWRLLEAGEAIQRISDWHERCPPVAVEMDNRTRGPYATR